ncbi:MAG: hypothetical protein ACTINM_02305 [Acetobacter cibinongensis]
MVSRALAGVAGVPVVATAGGAGWATGAAVCAVAGRSKATARHAADEEARTQNRETAEA